MSAFDEHWAEALSCALTGRQPGLPLPEAFAGGAARKPEDETLYRIAALGTYRLAGALPTAAGFVPRPEAGEGDCPLAAATLLPSLLREPGDFPLVRHWVDEAARRGAEVPFECAGAVAAAFEAKGVPVPDGPLEAWRAWNPAPAVEPASAFAMSSGAERSKVLRAWRRTAPRDAREAVAATLAAESAQARAALVGCLAVGLSPDEEPFLEGLLADRSAEVKAAAMDLLIRLPGSARAQEAGRIALAHVEFTGGRIEVSPSRSAILGSRWLEGQGVSLRGSGSEDFCAVVAAAPLSAWSAHAPADWIRAAENSRWSTELRVGWAIAARREASREWRTALVESLADEMCGWPGTMLAPVLLGDLSPKAWEEAASVLVPGCRISFAMEILADSPHIAWSEAFTDVVVTNLASMIEAESRLAWAASFSTAPIGIHGHPSCEELVCALAETWFPGRDDRQLPILVTLERRRAIANAFPS